MSMKRPFLASLCGCLLSVALPSCTLTHGAFMEGATDQAANHKVLPVRAQPESLAHKRLTYHSEVYPGLKMFLQLRGQPDYIIEDNGFTKRQIVMFYLKKDQAYLMELDNGLSGQQTKVKGPEPIGKKTRDLLDALQHLEKAASNLANEGKGKPKN